MEVGGDHEISPSLNTETLHFPGEPPTTVSSQVGV